MVGGVVLQFVVHTEPALQDDGRRVGRIVSVRKATRQERTRYEEDSL
jgi:hypothetical protein